MKTIETIMTYAKSTKNKHVYGNAEQNSPVPSIYIERSELPSDYPKTIKLVISNDE